MNAEPKRLRCLSCGVTCTKREANLATGCPHCGGRTLEPEIFDGRPVASKNRIEPGGNRR